MQIQLTVTIDVSNEQEADKVRQVMGGYQFKGTGLINIDQQIKANNFMVKSVAKNLLQYANGKQIT